MSCRNPSWAPGWAALQGSGETCGAPTRVVRLGLGARFPSRIPSLGTAARPCFPHALRRAVHDRNACSTDICSLRLLAHYQSEHPRLDSLSTLASGWTPPVSRWGIRFGGSPSTPSLRPGGSARRERCLLPPFELDRTSDASSQHLARPRSRRDRRRHRRDRFHPVVVKRSGLSRSEAPSIVQGLSAGREPLWSDVPGFHRSRLHARRVFALFALPGSGPSSSKVASSGVPARSSSSGSARRPSIFAAQSTRGHSPQATSPLRFAKSERLELRRAPRRPEPTGPRCLPPS